MNKKTFVIIEKKNPAYALPIGFGVSESHDGNMLKRQFSQEHP